MDCKHAQKQLTQLHLDELTEPDAGAVQLHLDECSVCRARSRDLKLTLDLLGGALADTRAPASLSAARRAVVRTEPSERSVIRGSGWLVRPHRALAAAASLLIVASLSWIVLTNVRFSRPAESVVSRQVARPSGEPEPVPAVPRRSAEESGKDRTDERVRENDLEAVDKGVDEQAKEMAPATQQPELGLRDGRAKRKPAASQPLPRSETPEPAVAPAEAPATDRDDTTPTLPSARVARFMGTDSRAGGTVEKTTDESVTESADARIQAVDAVTAPPGRLRGTQAVDRDRAVPKPAPTAKAEAVAGGNRMADIRARIARGEMPPVSWIQAEEFTSYFVPAARTSRERRAMVRDEACTGKSAESVQSDRAGGGDGRVRTAAALLADVLSGRAADAKGALKQASTLARAVVAEQPGNDGARELVEWIDMTSRVLPGP